MNSFSIVRIKLKNYLQFRDAEIKLNPKPGKNIAVIEGMNGTGKSNIVRAIDWCLFNAETWESFTTVPMPVCNSKAFSSLKINSCAEINVEILLDTPYGQIDISRSIKAYKNLAGHERLDRKSMRFTACRLIKTGRQEIRGPGKAVAVLFPPALRRLNFIDGSLIGNLARTLKKDEIEKAIAGSPEIIRPQVVNLLRRDGPGVISQLSAGDEICVSYAALANLIKRGGAVSPLIIDSPFSRLSTDYRAYISAWLKDKFKDSQLILLLSGPEYSAEISAGLAPAISDRLEILTSAAGAVSEIKKRRDRRRVKRLS